MRIERLAFVALVLVSAACGRGPATAHAAPVTAKSPEALKSSFLAHRKANDFDAAMALFCSVETAGWVMELYERSMRSAFDLPVARVELAGIAPDTAPEEHTVAPIGRLVIGFDTTAQEGVVTVESFFYYGKHGDTYCLALPKVAEGPRAPPPEPEPAQPTLPASAALPATWNASPEALVRAYQSEYLAWNGRASATMEGPLTQEKIDAVEVDYANLLFKFTLPGFEGEPLAFGGESSHDPARERLLAIDARGDQAVVRTEAKDRYFTSTYEYELTRKNGRWYLLQVYYVDEEGRHPGL